jgi:outer membrane protein
MELFMKKLLTTISLAAMFATVSSADWGRIELGGGVWDQTPSGYASYSESSGVPFVTAEGKYISSEKTTSDTYLWLLIKHPIPIIPNIRLEYVTAYDQGKVTGGFKDFIAPTVANASIGLTEYDIIPYYNLLDNTFWLTVDLGLDIKVIELVYKAEGVDVGSVVDTNYEGTETIPLPLLYLRTRVEIPVTNIGVEADVKYITYSGSTVYDARVKLDYTLNFIPIVQPAFEIGYRVQKIDLTSDDERTRVDLEFTGVYAGLMLRF